MRRASRAVFGWGGWAKLASMVTTVAALAALWFTNQSLRATSDQYALARQTAVTERFAKAVEQLGNSSLDIRLGGIYLLERLASDSPADRPAIFEVLSAFVRTHAPNGPDCKMSPTASPLATDVQAVITVISRRPADRTEFIDLSNTCMPYVSLQDANLKGAQMSGANLESANLNGARLADAKMEKANLNAASFAGTDLTRARLAYADLSSSVLAGAILDRTILASADLRAPIGFGC